MSLVVEVYLVLKVVALVAQVQEQAQAQVESVVWQVAASRLPSRVESEQLVETQVPQRNKQGESYPTLLQEEATESLAAQSARR